MSQATSNEYIAKVLRNSDIVELVSAIKPDGVHNHNGKITTCCPNHVDTKFSAVIYPEKQLYKCRDTDCGASGNVFDFFMATFPGQEIETIINDIGDYLGIEGASEPVVNNDPLSNLAPNAQVLVEVQDRASTFFQEALQKSAVAQDYLKKRGLSDVIIKELGIGYAPAERRSLRAAMTDYDNDSFVNAGLVIQNPESGDRYDRFRDRIMFPIKNTDGLVIGFGGRILDKENKEEKEWTEPKYLNSPETAVFSKSHELYGLYEAREGIRDAGYVLVTEGYMDVTALRQWDVKNSVATLGTATGENHIEKLLHYTRNIVYGFDGDKAGRKAAWRAAETALPYAQDGVEARFLFLPAEHDPDSFIRAHGKDAFDDLVRNSITLVEFVEAELVSRYNLSTLSQKSEFVTEAAGLLRLMPNEVARSTLTERVALLTGVPVEGLMEISGFHAIPGESDSLSSVSSPTAS